MNFKAIGAAILLSAAVVNGQAQEEAKDSLWTTGGIAGLNFSQVALQNWAGGGQNSLAVSGLVGLFAKYAKDKTTWDNTLDLGYGVIKQGNADFIKSDDKIDFASKYGRQAANKWYYSALINFKSQFAPGYNLPNDSVKISNFLAPGYLLTSLGMDYKPNDAFTVLISPLTGKFTFVNDQDLANAGAFGVTGATYDDQNNIVTEGENFRAELGGYIKMMFNKDIMENVGLSTKLELFSNYLHTPQNIDVNWETVIAMKVNKFLTASISATVIYDDDIDIAIDDNDDGVIDRTGPRTQFKEVLAVGLSYKF